MNERQERIEQLAERWFAAETTDAEERELRDWLRRTEDLPASLSDVRAMIVGLDTLAEERFPAGRKVPLRRRMPSLWGFVAAAVTVLGLFVCAELMRKPYCYIDGVAVYDKEAAMQATVYLESFSALDESARMVDELIRNN
uniref:hypothetical protein n=1 Tax=Alistipes sp. D31t1_170403_E11 TaxID=2787128 RepID=UPI00189A14A0|nr:hypothetical protein [Alistipes sp. D31t1_170403_E11]